jgi:hypothetical protein
MIEHGRSESKPIPDALSSAAGGTGVALGCS